jgi:hypothetical protein
MNISVNGYQDPMFEIWNTELRSLSVYPIKCDYECRIYIFEEGFRDIFKGLIIDLSWKDRENPGIIGTTDGNPRVLLSDALLIKTLITATFSV